MERRSFIYNSAAATMASLIGVHDILASCTSPSGKIYKDLLARIHHLDLVTSTPIDELKKFYVSVLGLQLVSAQPDRCTIQAGETTIRFTKTVQGGASPFYHFAFNIPENKILKAREWQLKRTTLSATPSQLVDERYPKDIRHFQHWNAHSVFFWDPAGNLVEYIARHDLNNSAEGDFSSKDILCASEIAFIVDDADGIAGELKSTLHLQQYRNGDANFRAIGDENGLLLVMRKGRVWEGHTNISKVTDTFKTGVTIHADRIAKWHPGNYPFEINVKN